MYIYSPASRTPSHLNDVVVLADDLMTTPIIGLTLSLGFLICTVGGVPGEIFTLTDALTFCVPLNTPSLNV
jgi:hypothetical protein